MTSDIEIDLIHRTIKNQKCVLIIGPEAFVKDNGSNITDQVSEYLKQKSKLGLQQYGDGLYFFSDGVQRTRFCMKLEEFYEKADFKSAKDLFKKISEIPFHLIINLTPDKILYNSILEKGHQIGFTHYRKNKSPLKEIKPTKNNPLIYNMLGCVDDYESLVLSHNDLFDYFQSIFKEESMATPVKASIVEATNLIFLGVRFDRWYMQLLLRILYLHTNHNLVKIASNLSVDEETQTICYDHFRINFVPNNLHDFIADIHEVFKKEGDLREAEEIPDKVQIKDKIRFLIGYSDQEEALNAIEKNLSFFPFESRNDVQKEIYMIRADLSELRRSGNNDPRENRSIRTRINERVLDLVNKM